jgi:hypothetical protein
MVALPRSLGSFHVAQQGIHFGEGQLSVGTDRASASDIPEQYVRSCLEVVATPIIS